MVVHEKCFLSMIFLHLFFAALVISGTRVQKIRARVDFLLQVNSPDIRAEHKTRLMGMEYRFFTPCPCMRMEYDLFRALTCKNKNSPSCLCI